MLVSWLKWEMVVEVSKKLLPRIRPQAATIQMRSPRKLYCVFRLPLAVTQKFQNHLEKEKRI